MRGQRAPAGQVVYHFSERLEQAIVVSHARGVDFLMKDAKDRNGNKYEDLVEWLKMRGVQFDVCEITLRNSKLSKERFIEYSSPPRVPQTLSSPMGIR